MCYEIDDCCSLEDNACYQIDDCCSLGDNTCYQIDDCCSLGDNTCYQIDDCCSLGDNSCYQTDNSCSLGYSTCYQIDDCCCPGENTCNQIDDLISASGQLLSFFARQAILIQKILGFCTKPSRAPQGRESSLWTPQKTAHWPSKTFLKKTPSPRHRNACANSMSPLRTPQSAFSARLPRPWTLRSAM